MRAIVPENLKEMMDRLKPFVKHDNGEIKLIPGVSSEIETLFVEFVKANEEWQQSIEF